MFLKINTKSPVFLLSLFSLSILYTSPLKSDRLTPLQRANLCTDGYFSLAVGGFERCMRGEADKFWKELHREEKINKKQMNKIKRLKEIYNSNQKDERERLKKQTISKNARQERRNFKNGLYHKNPIKPSILDSSIEQKVNFCNKNQINFSSCMMRFSGFYAKNSVLSMDGLNRFHVKDLMLSYVFSDDHLKYEAGGSALNSHAISTRDYKVKIGDKVRIRYIGTLEDGRVFDDRYRRKPILFKLGSNPEIKGLHEGIIGMRHGGIRELVIPPDLGYGRRGKGKIIPPNSNLFFVVELTHIEESSLMKYKKEKNRLERLEIKKYIGKGRKSVDIDCYSCKYR